MPVLREVAVFFDATDFGSRLVRMAARLASTHDARLIGISYGEHAAGFPEDCFARGEAISDVIRHQKKMRDDAISKLNGCLNSAATEFGVKTELRLISTVSTDSQRWAQYQLCDVLIIGHPGMPGCPYGTVTQLLFHIGVPLLIVPECWSGDRLCERLTLTWNGSRESRRAVADSLPILSIAHDVQLLIVDAQPHTPDDAEAPEAALAKYLDHHGVKVSITIVSSKNLSVGDTIQSQALKNGSDTIVFGAYSKTRLSEILLDGVSRSLLSNPLLPLLTTH